MKGLARWIAAGLLILPVCDVAVAQSRKAPAQRELGRRDSRRIVRLLGIREGDSVAAVGASSTFLLPELSRAVGTSGRVFAIDWDRIAVQGVQHVIDDERLPNVTVILGNGEDTLLPQPVRRMVMVNSYRLVEDRSLFFATNRKYLSADGRIAVIDYYRRRMKIGPPVRERVSSHSVMREMKRFGYALVARHNISPYQYFLVYRPRARRG